MATRLTNPCRPTGRPITLLSQWYDLRPERRETLVQTLPSSWASSDVTVTTRFMSQRRRQRYVILTFATKKLSTGGNGQKEPRMQLMLLQLLLLIT